MRRKKNVRYCLHLAFLCLAYFAPPQLSAQGESEKFDSTRDTSSHLLIQAQSENLGNTKAVAIQCSQTGPYYNMDLFTSAETRDCNATEILTLSLNEYIQTLAPLLFHTHQWSSASIASPEDELTFSDEEALTLWEKAKRACKAFPSLLRDQQENALEQAHHLYCQARFLAATDFPQEGLKNCGKSPSRQNKGQQITFRSMNEILMSPIIPISPPKSNERSLPFSFRWITPCVLCSIAFALQTESQPTKKALRSPGFKHLTEDRVLLFA